MQRMVIRAAAAATLICSAALTAQNLSPGVKDFVKLDDPVIALEHVRIIEGTGSAALEDQSLIIEGGRIATLGSSACVPAPAGVKVLDLHGYTIIPGLVGMHDHMFYPAPNVRATGVPPLYTELAFLPQALSRKRSDQPAYHR